MWKIERVPVVLHRKMSHWHSCSCLSLNMVLCYQAVGKNSCPSELAWVNCGELWHCCFCVTRWSGENLRVISFVKEQGREGKEEGAFGGWAIWIWTFHTRFVSSRMLPLKVRARGRLWLQCNTGIHNVMLHQKYHIFQRVWHWKKDLCRVTAWFFTVHTNQERGKKESLSEGFSSSTNQHVILSV